MRRGQRPREPETTRTRSCSGERNVPPQVLLVGPDRRYTSVEAAWAAALRSADGICGRDPIEIRLQEGVYAFESRLVLRVTERRLTIAGEGRVVLLSEGRPHSVVLIRGKRARVTLRDLEIKGPVHLTGKYSNWKLERCDVDGLGSVGVQVDPGSACCRLRVLASRVHGSDLQHGIVVAAPEAQVRVEASEVTDCNCGLRVGGSAMSTLEVVGSQFRACKVGVALLMPIPNAGGTIDRNFFIACRDDVRATGPHNRRARPDDEVGQSGERPLIHGQVGLHYTTANRSIWKDDRKKPEDPADEDPAPGPLPVGPHGAPSAAANEGIRLQSLLFESCMGGGEPSGPGGDPFRGLPPPDVALRVYPRPEAAGATYESTDSVEEAPAAGPEEGKAAPPPVHLRAHSMFLQLHSAFFRALFASGMREALAREIEVNDFEVGTVRTFLRYCYTGQIEFGDEEGLGKPADGRPEGTSAARRAQSHLDLLRAAHFFGAPRLVSAAVRRLSESDLLDGATAVRALCLAEQIGCPELRALALKRAGTNRRELVRSAEFRALAAAGAAGPSFECLLLLCRAAADAPRPPQKKGRDRSPEVERGFGLDPLIGP